MWSRTSPLQPLSSLWHWWRATFPHVAPLGSIRSPRSGTSSRSDGPVELLDLSDPIGFDDTRRVSLSAIVITEMKVVLCVAAFAAATASWAQPVPSSVHPLHRPLDELLDIYVRDGFVYYNALRSDRAKLDRYVASLNS